MTNKPIQATITICERRTGRQDGLRLNGMPSYTAVRGSLPEGIKQTPPMPSLFKIGIVVLFLLGVGLSLGLFIDSWLQTRPIVTLEMSLAAVQISVLLIYREFSRTMPRAGKLMPKTETDEPT